MKRSTWLMVVIVLAAVALLVMCGWIWQNNLVLPIF
jgi:hypothetical protein